MKRVRGRPNKGSGGGGGGGARHRRLGSGRVRFGIARRDELDGRDVWVVGAESGDTLSTQFWVDARRWLVLRIIQRDPRSPSTVSDIRFLEYTELLDVPVPTRIRVYS